MNKNYSFFTPPPLKVNNVVATFYLNDGFKENFSSVEYEWLAARADFAEWNPRRFHAIILRKFDGGRCSALIYKTKKCVLAGAGSTPEEAYTLAERVCQIVNSATDGVAEPTGFQIANIVANVQLPFRIRAEAAVQGRAIRYLKGADSAQYRFEYEPTEFPALKCRISSTGSTTTRELTILAFNNGKLVLTGLNSLSQLQLQYEQFANVLIEEKCVYEGGVPTSSTS